MAAATASAASIAKITSTQGTHAYTATAGNNAIEFVVELATDADLDGVTDSPYLVLSGIQNAGGGEARAMYTRCDTGNLWLFFTYTVRPGDFATGVGVASFNLNGDSVDFDPAEPFDTTLPAAILDGETITISTISATVGTAPPFYVGNQLSVSVSVGGSATAAQTFTVSSSDNTKAKPATGSDTVTVDVGNTGATATIDLLVATGTGDPVTLTFHPQGVTGTAGDVTLSISINEAAEPAIVAVRPYNTDNGKYTAGLIQIEVELSGAITQVGTANPTLKLAMDPGGRTATLDGDISEYVGETSLFFTYTIQPGDAVADLDCEAGTRPRGLQIGGQTLSANAWSSMPKKGAVGSLGANADIQIETIRLGASNERTATLTGREGEQISVAVTRASEYGISPARSLGFTITPSVAGKVDYALFTIPAGENEATFTLDLVEATTTPLELRIHPNGYTGTAGDIVLSITITPGPKPAILLSGPSQLEEGSGIAELTVALARFPRKTTTVNLSATPATGALAFLSSTTLTWAAGDENPKTVTIQPLDGNANVTITATTPGNSYEPGSHSLFIVNRNPNLVSPPAEGWEPAAGGEGFAYTIGWSGTDVAADKDTLYVRIAWGDGATDTINGAQGSASHIYNAAGTFGITVEMHDKDGGVSTASGPAIIHHSSVGIQQHVETGASLTWIMPPPSSAAWSIVESGGTLEGPCLRSDPTGSSESAIIEATLSGAGLLTFDWRVSSYRGHYARFYIDGVLTESITRLTDWGTVSAILDDGVHRLRWTYEKGSGATSNEDAAFLDNVCWQPLSLSQALDGTNIVWTSGEDAAWVPQIGVTFDGIDAVRSRAVIGMQSSRIEATVTGAGTMSWAWKASVAGIAGVDVYLDGEVLYDDGVFLDGPSDWAMASIDIQGSGRHVICFEFWNCGTESTIDDCAYLDCVTWVPKVSENVVVGNVEIPVAWLNENAASFVDGNAGAYEAAALATAANGVNKVWECYVAGLVPTNATDLFRTVISIGADGAPEISWEPDLNEGGTKQERVYTVEGRESLTEGSWGSTNAASRFFRVKVNMP